MSYKGAKIAGDGNTFPSTFHMALYIKNKGRYKSFAMEEESYMLGTKYQGECEVGESRNNPASRVQYCSVYWSMMSCSPMHPSHHLHHAHSTSLLLNLNILNFIAYSLLSLVLLVDFIGNCMNLLNLTLLNPFSVIRPSNHLIHF